MINHKKIHTLEIAGKRTKKAQNGPLKAKISNKSENKRNMLQKERSRNIKKSS